MGTAAFCLAASCFGLSVLFAICQGGSTPPPQTCPANCLDNRCNDTTLHCTYGCEDGFHGSQCQNNCPENCQNCTSDTVCQACFPGFHDSICSSPCQPPCTACHSDSLCTACADGLYGTLCNFPCPENCLSCTSTETCDSCKDGYFGMNCTDKCIDNCAKCTSDSECLACTSGFFGSDCALACLVECKKCTNETICEVCNDGRFGSTCAGQCNIECVTCSISESDCNGHCKSGQHGNDCLKLCPRECFSCKSDTNCTECRTNSFNANDQTACTCVTTECNNKDASGNCIECRDLTWYPAGEGCCPCSSHCVDQNCDSQGHCIAGCTEGRFGDRCNFVCRNEDQNCQTCSGSSEEDYLCSRCDDGFYPDVASNECVPCNDGCVESSDDSIATCNQTTGECRFGCKERRLGDICQFECDNNCVECKVMDDSPVCVRCKDGFYSNPKDETDCERCNEHCKSDSDQSAAICNFTSGHCLFGCNLNYYGLRCAQRCSDTCCNNTCDVIHGKCMCCKSKTLMGNQCTQSCNQFCNQSTCHQNGTCDNGCLTGHFGNDCSRICSPQCRDEVCSRYEGYCTNGCLDGYFGNNCSSSCSPHCNSTVCSRVDGICRNACKTGWYGPTCSRECSPTCLNSRCHKDTGFCTEGCLNGKYGDFCQENCGEHCATPRCNKTNGSCLDGCEAGFSGDKCDRTIVTPPPTTPNQLLVPLVSAGGSFVFVVVLVVLIVVITRKRRKPVRGQLVISTTEDSVLFKGNKRGNRDTKLVIVNPAFGNDGGLPLDYIDENGDGESLAEEDQCHVNTKVVPLEKLLSFLKAKTEEDYTVEMAELPAGLQKPHDEAQKKENLTKNVYKDILPYDNSRVVLKGGDSDFINASYINGYSRQECYIAAQGPNKNTMKDFWRMAWQENVYVIAVLVNFSEDEQSKCDKYWPERDASLQQGEITVTWLSEQECTSYIARSLSMKKGTETKAVTQLQFSGWPDTDVPDTVSGFAEFHAKFRSLRVHGCEGRAIVHCSAGVGRTGVFIAMDILFDESLLAKTLSIHDTVLKLREQRVNMVQNMSQYVFLHKAVTQCALLRCLPVKQELFQARYMQLSMTLDGEKSLLERDLKVISDTLVLDDRDIESIERNKKFTKQNRPGTDRLEDKYRPILQMEDKKKDTDYINAVYLDGHTKKDAFIMTQFPLPETVGDFYRLVHQTNSSCIVVMETVNTRDKTQVSFLPKKKSSKTYGKVTLTAGDEMCFPDFDIVNMKLTHQSKQGKHARDVAVFHFKDWDQSAQLPSKDSSILKLLGEVKGHGKYSKDFGPVIVTCLNGSKKSGLFVFLSVVIEKLESESEVSMACTLRNLRARRPGIVKDLDQYRFCHDVVNLHLSADNQNDM